MTHGFDATTTEMMKANERNWDARTPVHVASDFYGLANGNPYRWFAPFEWDDLGDLRGRHVLHLQCHLGAETLAFPRKGAARTVGLDISAQSVREARRVAWDYGDDVEYVHSNVYDAVGALGGQRFDTIYTGKGALCYLPDLARWADTVAELLRPGGQLYVVEFHPLLHAFGPEPGTDDGNRPTLYADYLEGRGPIKRDGTHTYTDGPAVSEATTVYEWRHGLGEVVNAVLGSGLRMTHLRETDTLPWPRWNIMERTDDGWWRLPPEAPRVPLLFALSATKPA